MIIFPGSEVTGDYELPDEGAGSRAQVPGTISGLSH